MKLIYYTIALFMSQMVTATEHVHVFATPDTFNVDYIHPYVSHNIDINNDGLNDIQLFFYLTGIDTTISASTIGANGWEMEISSQSGHDRAVAYNCGANVNSGSGFSAGIAFYDFFNGQGPRYLSVRKLTPGGVYYYYGWAKLEVNAGGTQCIIYATGYSDAFLTGTETDQIVGNGECVHIGIDEQALPNFNITANDGYLKLSGTEPATIHVIDVLGKQLSSFQFEGGNTTYDMHNLGSGYYFIEAVNGTRKKTMKVIL